MGYTGNASIVKLSVTMNANLGVIIMSLDTLKFFMDLVNESIFQNIFENALSIWEKKVNLL